jgi:hypothetical protein
MIRISAPFWISDFFMFFYPQRFATIFNIFCFGVREIRGKNCDLTLSDLFTFSDRCRLRRSAVAMQRISAHFDEPKRTNDFIFSILPHSAYQFFDGVLA